MSIPRFKIVRRIASGGMCDVFEGTWNDINGAEIPVAIKKVRKDLPELTREKYQRLLVSEGSIANQLTHPNVGKAFSVERDADGTCLICEFIDGVPLSDLLQFLRESNTKIDPQLVLKIAKAITSAVSYAHSFLDPITGKKRSVLHRDLSPQNIMLSIGGEIKLVDFGIAKMDSGTEGLHSQSTFFGGKPHYMAPELFLGQKHSVESDAFSLGVVLFELFSLVHPFRGEDESETLKFLQANERPDLANSMPSLSKALHLAINRALALRPKDRKNSVDEINEALNKVDELSQEDFSQLRGLIEKVKQSPKNLRDSDATLTLSRFQYDRTFINLRRQRQRKRRAFGASLFVLSLGIWGSHFLWNRKINPLADCIGKKFVGKWTTPFGNLDISSDCSFVQEGCGSRGAITGASPNSRRIKVRIDSNSIEDVKCLPPGVFTAVIDQIDPHTRQFKYHWPDLLQQTKRLK